MKKQIFVCVTAAIGVVVGGMYFLRNKSTVKITDAPTDTDVSTNKIADIPTDTEVVDAVKTTPLAKEPTQVYPELFLSLQQFATAIKFKDEWYNRTSYFDPICRDEEIPEGLYTFTDKQGRMGLIHKYLDPKTVNVPDGQKHQTITNVVFQSYDMRKDILAANSSLASIQTKLQPQEYLERMAIMIGAQGLL